MTDPRPIPRIIHQTWKERQIPPAWAAYHQSWREHHPGWEHRLWTDLDLRELIRRDYAWFLPIYDGYRGHSKRVDAARYFMLHRHGGVYVDLDFESLRSVEELLAGHEVVFGLEPPAPARLAKAEERGLAQIACNAFCASPPGHPFWEHVFRRLVASHWEPDTLDATGPFFLSRAIQTYREPARVFLAPSELLYPITSQEARDGLLDDPAERARVTGEAFAIHHWSGTERDDPRDPPLPPRPVLATETRSVAPGLRSMARRVKRVIGAARRTLKPILVDLAATVELRRSVKELYPRVPSNPRPREGGPAPRILILTPVKDAKRYLGRHLQNLAHLSYPHDQISIAFLEGDSTDGTPAALEECLPALRREFARVELWKRDYSYRIPVNLPRWAPEIQLQRRAILARCRNYLLSRALRDEVWVLWIDVDLSEYPADVIQRLLAADKEIVVPNCVVAPGGRTFDMNTFQLKQDAHAPDPALRDGLFQPPAGEGRLYLSDLREHEIVRVDAVGGTMLLVNADLHREGLIFPTFPYKHYIETEGLAVMARDMGVTSFGLPNLEIVHP